MNRFLRTAPTRRLLATLAGIVIVIGGGAAIAVAASGRGPVPKPARLAVAIRSALAAKPVSGISADISFTDHLIDTSEIQGSDPLLTGGSGHIWISNDGRMRLELYGDNGDPEIVVSHGSWWVYDPTLRTVYAGKLAAAHKQSKGGALPSLAQIQTQLNQLATHLNLSGAIPGDVGGQAAYTIKISPKQHGGLIGQLQLAWDALEGVPLRFAVYARGDSTPVLELAATGVSYGRIAADVFKLAPPRGTHTVEVASPASDSSEQTTGKKQKQTEITGVAAVARRLTFTLAAPAALDGRSRQSVSLLSSPHGNGALLAYGQGLGGIVVIEEPATANSSQKINLSTGSGDGARGITLPTVTINGASGQELDTALGTILRFSSGGVTYTVMGSVRPRVARAAARAL